MIRPHPLSSQAGFAATICLLLAVIMTGCRQDSTSAQGQKYHCPMHPTYVSDRPGDCPICNMKLVPIKDGSAKTAASANGLAGPPRPSATTNATDYYCTMCPEVSSNAPGLCPECGMKLVPRQTEGTSSSFAEVPGRVAIQLSAERQQTIGLMLAPVQKRDLSRTVRTTAVVQHDETLYVRISPRFSGWVRKLYANYEGAPVEKGAPLFTVYSPELFAAQNEYLIAIRSSASAGTNASAGGPQPSSPLLQSARTRLQLLEVPDEEIASLEKRGAPSPELTFQAPFSGHVLKRNVLQGQSFNSGDSLLEIADLSRVWLRAAVYEYELPLISVGQEATIHLPNIDRTAHAKVSFIYPHIEPITRRGEIRLEIENPDHVYRPDMWANVGIEIPAGVKLAVPAASVIDTGQRYIAFAQGADNHLEPRELKIGVQTSDYWEVISGLKDGEQVVSRALFLVDSESQLKSAIAGMLPPGAGNTNTVTTESAKSADSVPAPAHETSPGTASPALPRQHQH